jgi:hypothetical protein
MTKRILITGMNKNQCVRKHFLKMQLKVVPSQYSLFNCLVDMGWEVDQRVVEIGEDLTMYDEVIVYIAGPRQLVAGNVFNGLWAVNSRPDCILAFDDWQVPDLYKGMMKCTKWEELTADFILGVNKKTVEELIPFKNELLGAVEQIASLQNRMLISAFRSEHLEDTEGYGAHLLFDKINYPRDRTFVYNPNPYHRNRRPGDFVHEGAEDPHWKASPLSFTGSVAPDRERRFNFASLVQSKTQKWLKKQGYTGNPKDDEQGFIGEWPVDLYGSKADTQKRLTEDAMCQTFQRDWACLMPGYDHAGSGWWRARPLQAADAGCILIGERRELEVYYGKDFPLLDLKAKDLVEATDGELIEIARLQREALYAIHPLDQRVQRAELFAVLAAAK